METRTLANRSDRPIFLVGASRSGTTLIQEALSRHANIHITSETHWFDDERCQRTQPIAHEGERAEVQDWFMSLAHQPFGHSGDPEKGWLDRHVFENESNHCAVKTPTAGTSQGTRDHYFHAYCKLDAQQNVKARWGEKTPRHVFRINDILKVFPEAKVICTVRDPRAMVTSYRQWSIRNINDLYPDQNLYPDQTNSDLEQEKKRVRDSYHPAIAALLWRGASRAALNAIKQHGHERIKIINYEALVSEPQETLHNIVEWLDEPFDHTMLDVPLINSSFDDFKASAGFHKQAIHRWKEQLSRSELAVIRLLCKREMQALDYQVDVKSSVLWPLHAVPKLAVLPVAVYRAWRANKDRTGNIFSYIWRRISV